MSPHFFEHFQGWKHSIFEYLFRVLEIVFFRGTVLFSCEIFHLLIITRHSLQQYSLLKRRILSSLAPFPRPITPPFLAQLLPQISASLFPRGRAAWLAAQARPAGGCSFRATNIRGSWRLAVPGCWLAGMACRHVPSAGDSPAVSPHTYPAPGVPLRGFCPAWEVQDHPARAAGGG